MSSEKTTGTKAPTHRGVDSAPLAKAQAAQEPVFYREAPDGRYLVYLQYAPGQKQ